MIISIRLFFFGLFLASVSALVDNKNHKDYEENKNSDYAGVLELAVDAQIVFEIGVLDREIIFLAGIIPETVDLVLELSYKEKVPAEFC